MIHIPKPPFSNSQPPLIIKYSRSLTNWKLGFFQLFQDLTCLNTRPVLSHLSEDKGSQNNKTVARAWSASRLPDVVSQVQNTWRPVGPARERKSLFCRSFGTETNIDLRSQPEIRVLLHQSRLFFGPVVCVCNFSKPACKNATRWQAPWTFSCLCIFFSAGHMMGTH